MSDLHWLEEPEHLSAPILVTAFEGWFDVGEAATDAVRRLTSRDDARHVGTIEAEGYFDFTQRRPIVRLDDDGNRVIEWPNSEIYVLTQPGRTHDLVLVVGAEPHMRWRGYTDGLAEIIDRYDIALVLTLGSMVAEAPHSRPLPVTGSTIDTDLADVLGLSQPSYEGPTGLVGVIHERMDSIGIPSVSLRVDVPHYVAGSPNPKAARALLERFERVTGIPTNWASLDEDAREWETRVNEAMADDTDVVEYVRRLEKLADDRAKSDVPSPDDIAAEFERYLRQHGE